MVDENEFNVEAADGEFSGFVDELEHIITGLKTDLDEFRQYKVESENEFDEFKTKLRRRLQNSREELDTLINALS